ncbi:MAG: large conductance mechanosensitive channel protein MscL [Anaerovoracaceae bacterium]|jgi:large conductance mechanosensitive channel
MWKEFKEFALKGSMMDLAVGMIIGAAFTAIVQSLVDDILNPIIGLFAGKLDFSSLFIALDGKHYASLKAAEDAGAAVIKYGSFISALINFLIMAFVVFLIVKGLNKMRDSVTKEKAEEEPTTRVCPYCRSEISVEATRCPNCTSEIQPLVTADLKPESEA